MHANQNADAFKKLSADPQKLLALYNTLSGSDYPPDTPIKVTVFDRTNDIGLTIDGKIIALLALRSDIDETVLYEMMINLARFYESFLLSPMDIFKIAKYLNKPISEVIREYFEFYEGGVSKVPVVRIKPKEYRRICPFSDKGRCIIHAVKPAVCALFPLGRMTDAKTGELTYILQDVPCGNKNQTQTVREWLNGFSLLDDEEFITLWHKTVGEISDIIIGLRKKSVDYNSDLINTMLFLHWYAMYDTEVDFMPQFTENCEITLRLAGGIKKDAENADNR